MVKFKLFFGSSSYTADEQVNEWLEEEKNVEVVDFEYQQARYGDHSICIMYKEK